MKKLGSLAADLVTPDRTPTFEDFWHQYPRATEKAKTLLLWNKMSDDDKRAAYRDVALRMRTHRQWVEDGGKYICSPRRYLFNEMWLDDIVPVVTHEQAQLAAEDGTIHARFWTMLIQFYGKQLIASYGETMPSAWRMALRGMTQKQASKILQHLANDDDPRWLPNLPKIKLLLRYSIPAPETKMLPRGWSDPKIAEPYLKKLRKILRYKPKDL